jgi:hypothetical protein
MARYEVTRKNQATKWIPALEWQADAFESGTTVTRNQVGHSVTLVKVSDTEGVFTNVRHGTQRRIRKVDGKEAEGESKEVVAAIEGLKLEAPATEDSD